MDSIEVQIQISKEHTELLNQFLDGLSTLGYYETLFDSLDTQREFLGDSTKIFAYFHPRDQEKILALEIFLETFFPESTKLEKKNLSQKDYEEAYKEFYKPFTIGKFQIIPTWEKDSANLQNPSPESIPLYLNPGLAFGTGHHETTQMVLELLPTVVHEGSKVLDLGTGSGILSIACGKLGASSIHAIDIDPNAVRAAQENWKENPCFAEFVCKSCGIDEWDKDKTYDCILANITFAVLVRNLSQISQFHSKDYLFSGIISEKKSEFLELLLEKIPGNAVQELERNGWVCIHWRRK